MAIYAHNNLFIQNKYYTWYFALIAKARTKTYDGYSEVHHIIPDSLGGSNDPNNLVRLSFREHFLCHWLLIKFVSDPKDKVKMAYALLCMTRSNDSHERVVSSCQLEVVKRAAKDNMSGVNNPSYGKKRYNNGTKEMRLSDDQTVPEGFVPGGLPSSEETRRKMSDSRRGKKHYNNGIREIKISDGEVVPVGFVLGRLPKSEETRRKIGISKRGKKRYNNGNKVILISDDQTVPEGFVPGGPPRSEETRRKLSDINRGKKCYNNGTKEMRLSDDQTVPEGFVPGGLPRS